MIQYISQDLFIRTNKSVKKNVIKLFKSGPAFSEERKEMISACSVVSDSFVTPWTVAHQASLSTGLFRQEYWSELPFPTPGELPDPGMGPISPASPALAERFFTIVATREAPVSWHITNTEIQEQFYFS